MKPRRFHGLKRPKLRQTWNKYNLYNIARQRDPRIGKTTTETFFQQKWRAKGLLRSYHGEHIVERKWERMFSRRLLGVVNMDPKYMAKHDGSEKAAGRGSGKDDLPRWGRDKIPQRTLTPYMQMAFAPMERRLDIAVFRAMFASSARQARQFCVHGAVTVNGKVMPFPAYRLNPGDMFQVNPEMVLFATGAKKEKPVPRRPARQPRSTAREDEEADSQAAVEEDTGAAAPPEPATEGTIEQDPETTDAPEPVQADMKPTKKQIQAVTKQARAILKDQVLNVAQKQDLRGFIREIRSLLSRAGRPNASPTEITDQLATMVAELNIGGSSSSSKDTPSTPGETTTTTTTPSSSTSLDPDSVFSDLSESELKQLEQRMAEHMRKEAENPYDPTKPYATPWRPRPYMGPFAFIPRYLEVNQNVCSAVYLRHPVARVGSAEVPTPFDYSVGQLAYNWYLRRR